MPVIGIALVVGIAVILAVVISIPIFGIAESITEPAPTVVLTTDINQTSGNVTVFHESGETIRTANLSVEGATNWTASNETLRAGESLQIEPDPEAAEVIVAWNGEHESAILAIVHVQ